MVIILAGCSKHEVHSSSGVGDNLSTSAIFKNSQEKYASLTSYNDEGETVAIINGTTLTTTFTIKLARPDLYRIKWAQSSSDNGIVWSAGNGDFMDMGNGSKKLPDMGDALGSAGGVSASASTTIPWQFFKMHWDDQFGLSEVGKKQQADEKVGGVDCYVFTTELNGRTKTFWIGKLDFLIHQVRNVTSAEAMKAMMEKAMQGHPEMAAQLKQTGFQYQGIISTEIHTNIVENINMTANDFAR